eukprot:scaffold24472_cov63-Phaeocystis_antarctica.AAC.2
MRGVLICSAEVAPAAASAREGEEAEEEAEVEADICSGRTKAAMSASTWTVTSGGRTCSRVWYRYSIADGTGGGRCRLSLAAASAGITACGSLLWSCSNHGRSCASLTFSPDSPLNPIITTLSITGSASCRGGCSPRKLATVHTGWRVSGASQGGSVQSSARTVTRFYEVRHVERSIACRY